MNFHGYYVKADTNTCSVYKGYDCGQGPLRCAESGSKYVLCASRLLRTNQIVCHGKKEIEELVYLKLVQ